MIISFDLDDTLIPGIKRFDTEPQNLFQKIFNTEKIRLGTISLIKRLRKDGHKIFIYTTSYRSISKIKRTFLFYGIRIDKAINQVSHNRMLKDRAKVISKYPPAFGIHIHIDDSEGVATEGLKHNFRTIIINENTGDWTTFVLNSII